MIVFFIREGHWVQLRLYSALGRSSLAYYPCFSPENKLISESQYTGNGTDLPIVCVHWKNVQLANARVL